MPKPQGGSSKFGLGYRRPPYRYALAPYAWDTSVPALPHWRPPVGGLPAVDLRPLSAQAAAGGAPSGFGFFACLQSPGTGVDLATGPHFSGIDATTAIRSAWQSATGYLPAGAKLSDLLWDQLTVGSDPSGQSGPRPLVPETDGFLRLYLPGHSLVRAEKFRWGHHPHTGRLRDLLRRDFAAAWEATDGDDHCRRALDYQRAKYRVDWRELVPPRLLPHVPGPLPHATTITDNFNRTDADALGSSSEGWSWTETTGDVDVVSNAAKNPTSAVSRARAESDLSGADHYSQAKAVTNSDNVGPAVRYAAAAETFYVFWGNTTNSLLYKCVSGSFTSLASGGAVASNSVMKAEINGSSLTGYKDGVSHIGPATDTSITGNTRTGITFHGSLAQVLDDFQAADLGAAPAGQPTMRRFGGVHPAAHRCGSEGVRMW